MTDFRIKSHPILHDTETPKISFTWKNQKFLAKPHEMISSALIANGVTIFGHHPKDGSSQGIFCANGQCSQCLVIANGIPVKACMTSVMENMAVLPMDGLPLLPEVVREYPTSFKPTPMVETEVLIIGGGPAGLSAAISLAEIGIRVLLVDDKEKLGGKLVLQTHRFFGSSQAVFAGTRGIDIAKKLEADVRHLPDVEIWNRSTAIGVFEEKTIGILRENEKYILVKPKVLLVASGAREKNLAFPGNTLSGVYGAGAFQTLVNRDLLKPCSNLMIVGGGNVGLIAGYHAIQAGIHVSGLVEAAPRCGGYKVHQDKLARSGVPIYTSHTIVEALGQESVEKVVVEEVDANFMPVPGTEKAFDCDTLLIAVGLDPVNEFFRKAKEVGLPVYAAGDAQEIAEASAAIFSGRITGNLIGRQLGKADTEIPQDWTDFERILKSKPGKIFAEETPAKHEGVFPILHCSQEIPCDPCSKVCPKNLIWIDPEDIRKVPKFTEIEAQTCIGCMRCLAVCPGLAISLVDFRRQTGDVLVSLPIEQEISQLKKGDLMTVTDTEGNVLASLPVVSFRKVAPYNNGTTIVTLQSPEDLAMQISGFKIIESSLPKLINFDETGLHRLSDQAFICRCERITVGEIRNLIRGGVRDINQIKAVTKASMGACGGKTCLNLIKRLYQEEGVPLSEVTDTTIRPVFVEVPIFTLANFSEPLDGGR